MHIKSYEDMTYYYREEDPYNFDIGLLEQSRKKNNIY
jgi:hypothetical protein